MKSILSFLALILLLSVASPSSSPYMISQGFCEGKCVGKKSTCKPCGAGGIVYKGKLVVKEESDSF